jgi:hypothetical protein
MTTTSIEQHEKRVSVTMTNKPSQQRMEEKRKRERQNAPHQDYLNQKPQHEALLCRNRLHIVHLVILFFNDGTTTTTIAASINNTI